MAKPTSQDGNPADPNTGRDYLVRYSTSPYQNGTLVLRFASDPSPKQLIDAVANYGVSPSKITDISAQIVPTLAMRQAQRHPAQQPNSYRSQSTPRASQWSPTTGAQPARSSARSTGTAKVSIDKPVSKSRFPWGRALGILVFLFMVFSLLNGDAHSYGEIAGSTSPPGESLDRLGFCVESLETHRGFGGGPFSFLISGAPTEFPVSPPNAAFVWGCVAAD